MCRAKMIIKIEADDGITEAKVQYDLFTSDTGQTPRVKLIRVTFKQNVKSVEKFERLDVLFKGNI